MAKAKILIVEDDEDIVEMISYNLQKEGYKYSAVFNGEDVLEKAEKENPALIILDVMLPGIDGFEVCRILKSKEVLANIPIIMLTAKSQETDKIVGLELGADDYMTKPFSPRELIARVKAILRRYKKSLNKPLLQTGDLVVDILRYKVMVKGNEISLTPTEFKILKFMMRKQGVVVSRNAILDNVFGYDSSSYDRTIDTHMKSLRKKLGVAREYIETVRGIGYRLKEAQS